MNTLKFSKSSILSTEQHNLEVYCENDVEIFDKKLNIYVPNNLNLFITNICNCKCFFCINSKYTNKDISDDLYYKALNSTLDELNPNDFEITITGGEPTLNKERFVKTIELCYKKGFKFRTVSTNGFNLMSKYKDKELCQYLIENDAIHNINISRMDINNNKRIMGIDPVLDEDIEKLSLFFKMHDAEMRISCNLIDGYVDNMDKILEFVYYYQNLGVPTIMFRELVGVDKGIKLEDVFKTNKGFKFIERLKGNSYDVDVYSYKDNIVKHYIQKDCNVSCVNSFSLRNGILREGFNGEVIKNFLEDL